MSYLNQKSLIVVGGVIAALFAGTVLLGGYAKSGPAKTESSPSIQAKGCCPMMGAQAAQESGASCPSMAKAASNAESCPMGKTEPCCAEEGKENECGKTCPPDCPKPCCAKETASSGCASSTDAAGSCCPATTSTTTK